MRDGAAATVTAVSTSNVTDGWREHRMGGVIEVGSVAVVREGLSMSHLPRRHPDGQLHVFNSGTGELGRVNRGTGRFEPGAFLPGLLRGPSFVGGYATVGLSEPRGTRILAGPALQARLDRGRAMARCGVMVADL